MDYGLVYTNFERGISIQHRDTCNSVMFLVGGPIPESVTGTQVYPKAALTDTLKSVLADLSSFYYGDGEGFHLTASDDYHWLAPLDTPEWQNFYDHAVCDLIGEE